MSKELQETKMLLINEIKENMDQTEKMELGTEEYEDTVNATAKLVDKVALLEEKQNNKLDILLKNGVNAAGMLAGTGVSVWAVIKTFKFDGADQILSSTLGKNILNSVIKLNPFRK